MNTKCRKRKLNTRSNILNRIIWYQVNVQIIIPPYCCTLFARMTSDLVISKYFVNINHDTATQIFLIESQMSNSNHAICQLCWIDYQIFCWIHIIDWRHHNVQLLYHLVLSKFFLEQAIAVHMKRVCFLYNVAILFVLCIIDVNQIGYNFIFA